MINGKRHTFAVRGLYNGLALLADRESGSYWDHITGECLHGPLKGHQLQSFPLRYTTVAQELSKRPDCQALYMRLGWFARLVLPLMRRAQKRGFLPPHFRYTMRGSKDLRRPVTEMGLGVWTSQTHRFYPMARIRAQGDAYLDQMDGRSLLVCVGPDTGIPVAFWTAATQRQWDGEVLQLDSGERVIAGDLVDGTGRLVEDVRPMQMFTRWYGFSYTFPGCEISS